MAGLMDLDWNKYRDEAGRQTAALNLSPGVADPAKMSDTDAYANTDYLYGKDQPGNGTLMPGVRDYSAEQAVQSLIGRKLTPGELQGLLGRLRETGGRVDDVAAQIAAEIKLVSNDPAKQAEVSAMAPGGPAPDASVGGLMGMPANATTGGMVNLAGFGSVPNTGLMGYGPWRQG